MSENYSPNAGAEAVPPYTTVFLSQRDVGLRVPINFVTSPAVSLRAACFPHEKYEDDSSGDCLSNLLAVGFRKFILDLYWDEGRNVWSFCPVAIPADSADSPVVVPIASSARGSSKSGVLSGTSGQASTTSTSRASISAASLNGRQETTTPGPSTTPTTTDSSSASGGSLGDALPSAISIPNTSNEPLVSVGPFVCTSSINLSTFTTQLLDYIQKTHNTLGAHLLYVIINVHAAASASNPAGPAPSPTSLPAQLNFIGQQFYANLSNFIYTETNLKTERLNLNSSWYTVPETSRPLEGFYSMETIDSNILSTHDGWPSEAYIEFEKSKRLLLGWGTVDPQMLGYNFSGDSGTIFSRGYLEDIQTDLNATASGQLTNGCFLSNDTDHISQDNSSWALGTMVPDFDYPVTPSADLSPLVSLTSNLTACGISPLLNITLLNSTARDSHLPYLTISHSSIWSWAPGQPQNASSSLFRCALLPQDQNNHWIVDDCSQKRYAACRVPSQPYNWTIADRAVSYSFCSQSCPDEYDFAVPRTALENAYLGRAVRESKRDFDDHGVWLDFNSLDVEGCWTSGGGEASCPYSSSVQQMDTLEKRVILVPTVAAIIVLILTVLSLLGMLAGNRKARKRKGKRAMNGVVYEGVPS